MNTYAIVLHFDSEATKKINEFIEAVSKRTGNTYMIDTNIPPHITVGCYTAKEDSRILAEVKEIIGEIKSGSIVFDEMKENEIKEAMKETEKIELPLIGRVTEAALAKCNPYKEIYVWTL